MPHNQVHEPLLLLQLSHLLMKDPTQCIPALIRIGIIPASICIASPIVVSLVILAIAKPPDFIFGTSNIIVTDKKVKLCYFSHFNHFSNIFDTFYL